jgi:hypothetical protein
MSRPICWRWLALVALPSPCTAQVAENPADAERKAIAAIEKARGSVLRDEKRPGSPVTDISFFAITDADLETVFAFAELERLSVQSDRITDAGVARIGMIRTLKSLGIGGSAITDDAWVHLAGLTQLEGLSIRDTPISDAGLVHLERLSNLRNVTLHDTNVTEAGVARLKAALPYALVSSYRDTSRSYTGLSVALAAGVMGTLTGLAVLVRRSGRGRRPWVGKSATVAVLFGIVGAGLLLLKERMRPIKDGEAGAFWYAVTKLDVGTKNPSMGSFYLPRDGWFIYYESGFHGQFLYRLDPAEAQALLPKVVDRLGKAPPGRLNPDVEKGFRDWVRTRATEDDPVGLMTSIHAARETRLNAGDPTRQERVRGYEGAFAERWARAGRYSWNVWFEFAFLSGMILFVAWPWVRGLGRVQRAIHLGLTPCLFCLPFWLGYAPLTFTSAGDTEGVLYPRLLMVLRGLPRSDLDTAIVRALPKPLEPLNQLPGPMMSLSGFGAVGPVVMLTLGLVIGVAIVWGPKARRCLGSRLRHRKSE